MRRPAAQRFARRTVPRPMLAVLLLLALTGACSRLRHEDEMDQPDPAIVVFVNESLDQADVFAVGPSSESIRIGTVLPGETAELKVPTQMATAGQVSIVARLLARSRAVGSGPIPISPGTRYQVRLPVDERTLTVLPAPDR